jgi:hypothetical protein
VKLPQFLNLVREMRRSQISYFNARKRGEHPEAIAIYLETAREKERAVDEAIRQLTNPTPSFLPD